MTQPTQITGSILIGQDEARGSSSFAAISAATGEALGPPFQDADATHVAQACALAAQAWGEFSERSPAVRAQFLERIGAEIVALGEPLIARAMAETGLPRARLEGERARTVGQLEFFAALLREGSWMDATLDQALPQRTPQPRPDLRRRHVAIGPVAVFGASNFPLAFSVAGGDTAAALAAGCPVVVKGHPAHPGTGELVARAVRAAVVHSGLPAGTFSYLPGATAALGAALVADPRIRAVGFTGSRAGGLALARIASERPEPIAVFAEMSSINPVILLPAAARARGAALGRAYVASLTLGAGQFCTNPGVVLLLDGTDYEPFVQAAQAALTQCGAQQMLAPNIQAGFSRARRCGRRGQPGAGGPVRGRCDALPGRCDAAGGGLRTGLGAGAGPGYRPDRAAHRLAGGAAYRDRAVRCGRCSRGGAAAAGPGAQGGPHHR